MHYSKSFDELGTLSIRPFRLTEDSAILHEWVQMEYAVFWGMQAYSLQQLTEEYKQLMTPDHYDVFVGVIEKEVVFVLERYQPKLDPIASLYPVKDEDCGIHIIVAPPRIQIPNFTWYLFTSIMDFVFQDPRIDRILVEPDIRNKKMFALCQRIGFKLDKVITFSHKTAQVAYINRTDYANNTSPSIINKRSAMNTLDNTVSPQQSVTHLQPEVWAKVNTQFIKKAICEFTHELLIQPVILQTLDDGWATYIMSTDHPEIQYQFITKPMQLNHLWIRENSITKFENDQTVALDGILFIQEIKNQLGITEAQLPIYLEEIISTLYGSAFKFLKGNPTAAALVDADFQTIEQAMTEGHPGFVANNGRIGFDSSDYRAYAPEAGNSFSILWLAGHKSRAVYAATQELSYDTVIQQELDSDTIASFREVIEDRGFIPDDYYFIPIHPWQWFNKLATIFSPEIAKGNLICLGYGSDQYLAQQSIRTLFNSTHPHKFYTKTALSILNMGFMRGLPLYYLGTAPKMAVWLEELLYNDPLIKETGFCMLGEVASISYINPYFETYGVHNDYNKMLASLWRESPYSKIKEGQQVMTMAAFLHIDHHGEALLPAIIKQSGIAIEDWLHSYLKAYLSPLLHCFYHFDLVFMPHGENIIMVLENHVPVQILLKDITEEACILNPDVALPEVLKRMYAPVPEDVKLLSIFTDIFDGFFRFMAQVLEAHCDFPEDGFWNVVAKHILEYQDAYPEKEAKFKQYDLFAPEFKLSCLNRLQLNNHKQMIDLDDPVALLQFAGTLENPIAAYSREDITVVS